MIYTHLAYVLYADKCPTFTYLHLTQLREYSELRLGSIKKLMQREMRMLVFMSRIVRLFGILFKAYKAKTTNLFNPCFSTAKLNEAQMLGCFFKAAVSCLKQEYKSSRSYYSTWSHVCNPIGRIRTSATETVDWKPVHVNNLDNETVSALFNLATCVHLKGNFSKSCPYPCLTEALCKTEDEKLNVASLRCWMSESKWDLLVRQLVAKKFDPNVRAFNYSCDCLSHLRWSDESRSCEPIGQECDSLTKFPCVVEHTISCDTK